MDPLFQKSAFRGGQLLQMEIGMGINSVISPLNLYYLCTYIYVYDRLTHPRALNKPISTTTTHELQHSHKGVPSNKSIN